MRIYIYNYIYICIYISRFVKNAKLSYNNESYGWLNGENSHQLLYLLRNTFAADPGTPQNKPRNTGHPKNVW